ncbi:hypothetical protein WN48_06109 [Eufriesea mexicana]|uniref:uncharacterized protein LOC108545211 n=1 Tax=Eufriesea mexicana TaxID=516756 RepID=UPI00083C4FFF|nr:PREDICTED: uncharacterized protein LOC108545211 [Eufriesea mexicana]OAD60259.1 hypothetical protein WN48_06109 [Eufriesea mexicana]
MYTCTGCKYESNRYFNMERHKHRIHSKQKLHICCGESFYTKGAYYVHCERSHPETRLHAIVSKHKYKITGDLVPFDHRESGPSREEQADNLCRMQLRSESSVHGKNRVKQLKTKVSLEYSLSYNEVDIENIPLMSFLTDHRLMSRFERSCSKESVEKAEDEQGKQETNRTVTIAISSEQEIQKTTMSTNDAVNVRTKVSNSSVSSISLELPLKKLILHRFRSSVHEFEVPLREKNADNDGSRANLTQELVKEMVPTVKQRWLRKPKRLVTGQDKENVSEFAFNLQKQLNIKLDTGIEVPVVSQVHRDFLGSINFDEFKIC